MLSLIIATALIATATPLPYDPDQRMKYQHMPKVKLVLNGTKFATIQNDNSYPIDCYIGLKIGSVIANGFRVPAYGHMQFNSMIYKFGFCVDARQDANRGSRL